MLKIMKRDVKSSTWSFSPVTENVCINNDVQDNATNPIGWEKLKTNTMPSIYATTYSPNHKLLDLLKGDPISSEHRN